MKKLLFTLLLLIAFPVMASHIVGGEFELVYISENTYRLNLIVYFDKKNGEIDAKDKTVTVSIFRKSDNTFIRNVLLPLTSESEVSYTQPACSEGEIQTLKLTYTALVILDPKDFSDPGGYYVSWQRCCRNYSIDNIYSPPVPPAPFYVTNPYLYAGQTFYLEFPPVMKNGKPFIDSTPQLFPPLNDYACPNKPYYTDFAGKDVDGDSLVYSLVTPLSTFSSAAEPPISQGPYPNVKWKTPYSLTNIMNGLPDLRISIDGLLTCTPRTQGLFVFAVKVEEFRDKIKIGESRRDFQMLVLDKCPVASPPVITGKKLMDANFTYTKKMSVSFDNAVSDADRCIEVRVSDLDSSKPDQGNMESISIRVVGMNFKSPQLDQILPSIRTVVLQNGSTADFRVCFPQCPFIEGPYEIGIIVSDDACTQPLTDTLRVTVNMQLPINHPPTFTTGNLVSAQINEGVPLTTWVFNVTDVDMDDLVVSYKTNGFNLQDYGMTLTYTQNKGSVDGKITWDSRCNIYNFTQRTDFTIQILVDDNDLCNFGKPTVATYNLKIKLPDNTGPIIDTDLTADLQETRIGVSRKIFETVEFNVNGKDIIDNDLLVLDMKGIGFNLSDYGISFPSTTATGTVSSKFLWNIGCVNMDLKRKNTYTFQFIVTDNVNKCRFYKADTVTVDVHITEPNNEKPIISIVNPDNINIGNTTIEYTLGQPIEFTVSGTDSDLLGGKDNLSLSLKNASGIVQPIGFSFLDKKGKSPISSVFSWSPNCSIFKNDIYQNEYEFKFSLTDDRCLNAKGDEIAVKLKIKDVESMVGNFELPNIFTPNGDKVNEYFLLEGTDSSGTPINKLPKDNCSGQFVSVIVINRWGEVVFESRDRHFTWDAKNMAAGVYFYRLIYTNREYKSSLTVYY